MAWQGSQQATEAVKRAKRTLILAPENASMDAISTTAAVLSYLKAHNLPADAFIPNLNIEKLPAFLPSKEHIKPKLAGTRDFKITLDVGQIPIHEFSYDIKDGKLQITLTPKAGEWKNKDVTLHPGEDRYDLIITAGCADRNALGNSFREHADFIYRSPIINLDHDPKNEHWASINLVDLTASSTAEVAFNWLSEWNEEKIDQAMATALLTGMISNTQSFRTPNVTPKTLEKAARLMSMGADREAIVNNLWRTRQVSTLKLWGKALTRLEQDKEKDLVWTVISKQDILDSGANEAKLDELVQELLAFAPSAKLIAIFVEHDSLTTRMALFAQPPFAANLIGRSLGLDGSHRKAAGAIAKPLLEAKEHAIQILKQQIKR